MEKRTYGASHTAKQEICIALKHLMAQKPLNKITIAEVMRACGMARQHFYYHFEDIPALFRWVLEKKKEQIVQTALEQESPEKGLRYFLLMAINATPYVKKAMQSNYRDELDHLLTEYVYLLFEQIVEREGLYQTLTRAELKFVLRYHSQAVLSIIRDWTDEDMSRLDQIAHLAYLLMAGQISPHE